MCPNEGVDYAAAGGSGGSGGGGGGGGFASRAPPPGRGLNVASLPPVKCYRCGGPNHMARYVLLLGTLYMGRFKADSDCFALALPCLAWAAVTAWHRRIRSQKI